MADDDDDDDDNFAAPVDEEAYDMSDSRFKRPKQDDSAFGVMAASSAAPSGILFTPKVEDTEPDQERAEWAAQWKVEQDRIAARANKLKGVCVKWHANGFGFIKRYDGAPDIYVHQRDIAKRGYRSLKIDEPLEFDEAAMEDGRLHAINVTGPNGADVIGGSKPERDDSDEDEEAEEEQAAQPIKPVEPPKKPAFLPRAVKRPAPKAKPATAAAAAGTAAAAAAASAAGKSAEDFAQRISALAAASASSATSGAATPAPP